MTQTAHAPGRLPTLGTLGIFNPLPGPNYTVVRERKTA